MSGFTAREEAQMRARMAAQQAATGHGLFGGGNIFPPIAAQFAGQRAQQGATRRKRVVSRVVDRSEHLIQKEEKILPIAKR